MNKLEFDGFFYDGESPVRNIARIAITSEGLSISYGSSLETLWIYKDIRQSEEVYSDTETHLLNISSQNQQLIVHEPHFLSVVKKFFPSIRFYEAQKIVSLRRLAVVGVLLLILLVPLFYFIFIPSISEVIAKRIPVSVEERLSKPYLAMMVPEESLCNGEKNFEKIETIFESLTATVPESGYNFKLFVVKSDIMNAFALPGGYVVIYSALLENTDRPEQLAGVLAHEIQHVTNRHGTEALVRDYSLSFLISVATGDTGSMETTLGLAKYLGLMNYSRENETEADVEGMKIMEEAKIDPDGMVEFFEILDRETGDMPDSLRYLSTHPQTDDRILKLKELAGVMKYQPVKLHNKKEWEEIKKICDDESIKKMSFWGF